MQNLVPNVTLEPTRGTNATLSAFIRGVGQQDPVAGFEQGVGVYIDDVYLNRPHGAVVDIYDVERIEVLRGPQGTLRSEEHTSELQSLMRISYAVFCLKTKKSHTPIT